MLPTAALDYTLPEDRIATAPVSPRDSARMLVLRRADPEFIEHRQVRDLPEYLSPGDVLVVNTSRVIPARIQGVRADTMGKVEGLYLGPVESDPSRWRVMLKGRRMRENARIALHDADGQPTQLSLILHRRSESEGEAGAWICSPDGPADLLALGAIALLDRVGSTPLPPYILAARKRHADAPTPTERDDRVTYQTVYARADQPSTSPAAPGSTPSASHGAAGSIAAPTAGLHFTPELLGRLAARGVLRVDVTLHVGTGTFKPVECEFVEQ
ncbi:MAG: S-adenosylmethionine:tRNA ribosyltransferase-isomerase, partial [Phycisphaerales bacterium]